MKNIHSRCNILLSTHYTPTPGPMNKLAVYLKKHGHNLVTIFFPLFPKSNLPTIIDSESNKIELKIPWFLQFFVEGIVAMWTYTFSFKNKPTFDLALCADPLAFFQIYLFKKLYKIKKIVYFNVDFSTKRYQNLIMDFIYQTLNKFAYVRSDYFMSLTPNFMNYVDPKGQYAFKTFILTHWVNSERVEINAKKKSNFLIYAGSITKSLNFNNLLEALLKMKENHLSFHLDIYGDGDQKESLQTKVRQMNLQKEITFMGVVENTTLTQKILPQYIIGLCPYIIKNSVFHADHMFQGVSLTTKLVEYVTAGLPILTTPLYTAFNNIDTYKFGFLVATTDDWYQALQKLLNDRKIYEEYRTNALKYSKQFDEERVLNPIFNKILYNE